MAIDAVFDEREPDDDFNGFARDPYADLATLRILKMTAITPLIAHEIERNPYFKALLGIFADKTGLTPGCAMQRIANCLASLPSQPETTELPLHRNIRALAEALRLNHAETEVLRFALLLHSSPILELALSLTKRPHGGDLYMCIARACDVPIGEVKAALSPRGTLHTSGLVQVDRNVRPERGIRACLDVMQRFSVVLHTDAFSPEDLLGQCAAIAPQSTLQVGDYQHLSSELTLVRHVLHGALEQRARGVNLLFWGPPGTGKTEFARLLGDLIGCTIREIVSDDAEGDAVVPHHRGTILGVAQRLLDDRHDTVLVFDEMEDEMSERSFQAMRGSTHGKAWLNRLMETNPVPTIWITNDAEHLDAAILRRFSLAVKFAVPPAKARKRIIAQHFEGLKIGEALIDQLAAFEDLPPACIAQAARVARLLPRRGSVAAGEAVRKVISGASDILQLTAKKQPKRTDELPYSLRHVNADADLAELVRQIKRCRSARLCLYGLPGTGKSEFGRELARRLGRRLLVRRASDILGPYVGQTEQNIARTFREAAAQDAVLLIDEADSLIYSRADAMRSWERTMVNEFLSQMEDFAGVLVCSTNLPDALDEAAARRFDLQIRFNPMQPEQAWALYRAVLKHKGVVVPRGEAAANQKRRIKALSGLTQGDFAKAIRAGRLSGGVKRPGDLCAALERVVVSKDASHTRRGIGFLYTE